MDYFRKYLGANELDDSETGIEIIEKLVDRLSTSTLLDDRRDAVRALKSLSKKFRLEVGTQAMYPILNMLELDKEDTECAFYVLETLYNIMNEDLSQEEIETNRLVNIPTGLGCQFTEMFITKPANIELIILFIEDQDFNVRRISIQLIHVCLVNMQKETQEAILTCPMAISKIVDLLTDSNEVIRNDSLLLLIDLVKGNWNIQKIVAFENAFDHLLTIITEEGDSDGGVIVEDCLKIVSALIENNPQNQTLFKEGSFIKRLKPFFEILDETEVDTDKGWSPQKLANVQLMLQVVRSLVSPHNKSQATASCQANMYNCGLFQQLCRILMSSGIPTQLLTETVLAVAEAMRGCQPNQQLFCHLMAPSEPAQPAVNVLLLSMVNEGQSFVLRCAALYCFQCFLCRNPSGQNFIIQTLLPKSVATQNIPDQFTSGKLLCMGLFSSQPLSVWFAAVSLMHCINSNASLKEELLKVQLASGTNNSPISFLQKCCLLLNQGARSQTICSQAKIGILMLLCSWMNSCPNAVIKFLTPSDTSTSQNSRPPSSNDSSPSRYNTSLSSNNLSILISELTGLDNEESEIIIRGLCSLLIGICIKYNIQHQLSSSSNQNIMDRKSILQIVERRFDKDVLIDHLNHMTKTEAYTKTMRHLQPQFNKSSDVLFDYEFTRLFRSIEHEIVQLIQENNQNDSLDGKSHSNFTEHEKVVMQYKDLIKAQDEEIQQLRIEVNQLSRDRQKNETTVGRLQEEVQIARDQYALLKAHKSMGDSCSNSLPVLNNAISVNSNTKSGHGDQSSIQLKVELDHALQEIERLKNANSKPSVSNSPENWKEKYEEAKKNMEIKSNQIKELEMKFDNLEQTLCNQQQTLADYNGLKKELEELRDEHNSLRIEHDDLLVLLSDQEDKIRDYKIKLGLEASDNENVSSEENID